ncbi:MAG: quinone-dependent dihydroorotate dehydrogenase [Alphaproteobacteria bacterium]
MSLSYKITGPFIRMLSANQAHDIGLLGLKKGLVCPYKKPFDERLNINFKGLNFPHPIGLAPGFDKDAEAINPLAKTGLGHMEVGGVTPKPQSGNLRPTIFRSPKDQAIINRMGFNNKGLDVFLSNIKQYHASLPLGVNIGKNKTSEDAVADYQYLATHLANHVDWITINVSSPNTPGLRNLQEVSSLKTIIQTVKKEVQGAEKQPLIFVKIAPDLNENDLIDLAHLFKTEVIDAVVTTNTTISRPDSINRQFAKEQGGLSGRPLFDLSLHIQKVMATELKNSEVKIIGSGGIYDIGTAWQRIIYGASLLQIYSAMVWQGPYLAAEIAQDLSQKLVQEGFDNIKQAIGSAL